MINRTIGFLGLLTSVMALSSLIDGAFQESLGSYMHGVLGGVLDAYRNMRDVLFVGFGWAFSGIVNFFDNWLTWLPPAPWISLPNWGEDAVSLYFLFGSSLIPTGGVHPRWFFIAVPFWPVFIFFNIRPVEDDTRARLRHRQRGKEPEWGKGPHKIIQRRTLETHKRWLMRLAQISIGAFLFFGLAFAENRIGL